MIEVMAQVHMTEAEVARDVHDVLAKVQQGIEVVVEQDDRPVAVIRSPLPKGRLLSECIALAEGRGSTATLDEGFMKDVEEGTASRSQPWETALCSITELAHEIHRAETPERRERRRVFLDELKAAVPIYSVTGRTAELVGKIGAESAAIGVSIPFDDLLIGSCALERGYGVATRNLRHFQEIQGLSLISF